MEAIPFPEHQTCSYCGQKVSIRVCQSEQNGNCGRLYMACSAINNGVECSFFRWVSDSTPAATPSGSSSPNLGLSRVSPLPSSAASSSHLSHPGLLPPPSYIASSSQLSRTTCLSPGCLMTRIHPECTRFMCRRHCLEAGGCLVKGHSKDEKSLATQASQFTILQAPSTAEALPSPPLTMPPQLRQPGRDLHANLRYSSQMPAVFTEQSGREQELQESRRAAEAEHLRNVRKVNGCVTCYGWPLVCQFLLSHNMSLMQPLHQDDAEPTVCEFQDGFQFPHFIVTPSIVRELELDRVVSSDEGTRIFYFRHDIHTWTKIPVGHVINVKSGESVFLKAPGVVKCLNFDEILHNTTITKPKAQFHIRNNLPQERAYIRQAYKDQLKPVVKLKQLSKQQHLRNNSISTQDSPHSLSDSDINSLRMASPSQSKRHSPPIEISSDSDSGIIIIKEEGQAAVRPSIKKEKRPKPKVQPCARPIFLKRRRSTSPSIEGSSNPSSGEDTVKWPRDFYAVDIVHGFEKCEAASRSSKKKVAAIFEGQFGVSFKKSTYYLNRERWLKAPQVSRDKALAAGRTHKGLWSAFLDDSKVRYPHSKRRKHNHDE